MENQIKSIFEERILGKQKQRDTIFNTILDSDLPPEEVTLKRLQHEAISVVGAGLETTLRALTVATFHILSNPPVYTRLLEELEQSIPDPLAMPSWDSLMQLPYLSACIDECESNFEKGLSVLIF